MSANAKPDLQELKTKLANFRAGRVGKERIPENLWAEAVALLDHYPFNQVWQELRLKREYLQQRAAVAKGRRAVPIKKNPKFLTLTEHQLTTINNGASKNDAALNQAAQCRLVIERCDGSRLTLNLPVEWSRIEALCGSFLRG